MLLERAGRKVAMPRRQGALKPRLAEDSEDVFNFSGANSPRSKSRSYPNIASCVVLTVTVVIIVLVLGKAGFPFRDPEEPKVIKLMRTGATEEHPIVHRPDDEDGVSEFLASSYGGISSRPQCRAKICDAIPILQEVYKNVLRRTLHVGPGTCGVVSKLIKNDNNGEVWGVQPFDMRAPVHPHCENLVRKGIVRVLDPNTPLPYREKSFSLVLVTGTLEQMKSKHLNQTLASLARISSHSIMFVIGNGFQASRRTVVGDKTHKALKPRNRIWWQRRFAMLGLKENAEHSKKFEALQAKKSFKTTSNYFHFYAPGSVQDL